MAKTLSERVFPFLAIGLAKYTENKQRYPYPPELLYAQHHLSLAMLNSYPATITGFFGLCKKPLEEWWPGALPDKVDRRFELLEADGEVGQQVIEYLKTYKLPDNITPQGIQVLLDSELMGNICHNARKAEAFDPAGAQSEYVAVRSYVIDHPWTTREELRKELRDLRHIRLEDVGSLYDESSSVGQALLYQESPQQKPCYWNCSVCGPLYQRDGRLGSIKPGACEQRCPGKPGWQTLDVEDNTRVLKRGVHLSTYIPGTTEMELYRWLVNEVQPVQPALQQVDFWPGIDSYDLQLRFPCHVWAVDVKDYKNPFMLGEHIKQDNRSFEREDLTWHRWFYIYPTYHEWQRPNYGTCVRQVAEGLPANVSILNTEQFKKLVLACQ